MKYRKLYFPLWSEYRNDISHLVNTRSVKIDYLSMTTFLIIQNMGASLRHLFKLTSA